MLTVLGRPTILPSTKATQNVGKMNYLIVINVYEGHDITASYNHEAESPPTANALDNLCTEDLHRTEVKNGGLISGVERVAVVHGVFAL